MIKDIIKKMDVKLNNPVQYSLDINGVSHNMNDYIGKNIQFAWKGFVICQCGKELSKFYRSSFCYKCYWESPLASQSIFKPELCTAHLGIEERNLDWEKKFQLADHFVYLANSSGVKVGITRFTQLNTRWMDQGASQAIILALVPNRRFSGDIEVSLKRFVKDKTNWRKMLSGDPMKLDLIEIKKELIKKIPQEYQKYIYQDNTLTDISYPVNIYPSKIKSVKLDKTPIIEGILHGIKGQYLLLSEDRVFNVRSHEGYVVNFSQVKKYNQQLLF